MTYDDQIPGKQGLYDPINEHDACGIGFVVQIKNRKSHAIVRQGLDILIHLAHRGAVGADPDMGDGAGILVQMPDGLLRPEAAKLGITLPALGSYGVGMMFLPRDEAVRKKCEAIVESVIVAEGHKFLGWRDVPVDSGVLGKSVRAQEPVIRQVFVGRVSSVTAQDAFERKLYVIRKVISHKIRELGQEASDFYTPSMSSRTIVYKGMLLAHQVGPYYHDLGDKRFESALALVHQRFSTNTFPKWSLAHPFRMICHNGEINTLRGNNNWMAARRYAMKSDLLGDDVAKLWPISFPGQSDSACFDNALELLVQGGYSLAHAMMMMIPEAWAGNPLMDEQRRAFYEYHAALMEPWDGPAAVCFTDGRQIGATLDRNGLRPARYVVTDDDFVVMSSEVGVLPIAEERIVKKWRLQPGKMLLIDLEQGRIIDDAEIKAGLAAAHPYQEELARRQIVLEDLPKTGQPVPADPHTLLDRQQAFGYTQEDIKFLLMPLATTGQEAVGSMGNDSPVSVLSSKPKLLYTYFKQCFAQVTNPPIELDPRGAGHEPGVADRAAPESAGWAQRQQAHAPGSAPADLDQRGSREGPRHGPAGGRRVPLGHARHHLAGARRRGRHGKGDRRLVRRGHPPCRGRRQHPDLVRPDDRSRPGRDPGAARHVGRPSSSGA